MFIAEVPPTARGLCFKDNIFFFKNYLYFRLGIDVVMTLAEVELKTSSLTERTLLPLRHCHQQMWINIVANL